MRMRLRRPSFGLTIYFALFACAGGSGSGKGPGRLADSPPPAYSGDLHACQSDSDCVIYCPEADGCCDSTPCGGCAQAINGAAKDASNAAYARICERGSCSPVACEREPSKMDAHCDQGLCVAGQRLYSQNVCDAEVSDEPTAIFANNVRLRLPKNMKLDERTTLGDQGAGSYKIAVIATRNIVSTCEAIIRFGAVKYFETDPKLDSMQIRDNLIREIRGVDAAVVTWTEEARMGRDYTGAYELPAEGEVIPPAKGWFTLKEKGGRTTCYILETDPHTWNALAKTFKESGKHLMLVPQRP